MLTTQDEILLKYAALVQQHDSSVLPDVVKEIASQLGWNIGGAAISGVIEGVFKGKITTRILTQIAESIGIGVSGLGWVWVALNVLILIATLAKILDTLKANLDVLIRQLSGLANNPLTARPIISEWMSNLQAFNRYVNISGLNEGTEEERITKFSQHIQIIQDLVSYLHDMQNKWPYSAVSPAESGGFGVQPGDANSIAQYQIGSAKNELDKIITIAETQLRDLMQQLQTNTQKAIQEYGEKMGVNKKSSNKPLISKRA